MKLPAGSVWTAAQWLKVWTESKQTLHRFRIRLLHHHSLVKFVWFKTMPLHYHDALHNSSGRTFALGLTDALLWPSCQHRWHSGRSGFGYLKTRGPATRCLRKASNLKWDLKWCQLSMPNRASLFLLQSFIRFLPAAKSLQILYFANASCINSCLAWSISNSALQEKSPMLEMFDQHIYI